MKTYMAKPATVERKWFVIDAEGLTLGRMATQVAVLLHGKHKPTYTPHVDTGDHVIIVNAEKVVLTGKKLDQKMYTYHTGYVGGLKQIPYRRLLATKPEFAIRESVRRMLPKGPLGYAMLRKLRVYRGPEHKQQAQNPEVYEIRRTREVD